VAPLADELCLQTAMALTMDASLCLVVPTVSWGVFPSSLELNGNEALNCYELELSGREFKLGE
jgi:hypothetical protein